MHTLIELESGLSQNQKCVNLACGLTTFPQALYNLVDSLETLDLSK